MKFKIYHSIKIYNLKFEIMADKLALGFGIGGVE